VYNVGGWRRREHKAQRWVVWLVCTHNTSRSVWCGRPPAVLSHALTCRLLQLPLQLSRTHTFTPVCTTLAGEASSEHLAGLASVLSEATSALKDPVPRPSLSGTPSLSASRPLSPALHKPAPSYGTASTQPGETGSAVRSSDAGGRHAGPGARRPSEGRMHVLSPGTAKSENVSPVAMSGSRSRSRRHSPVPNGVPRGSSSDGEREVSDVWYCSCVPLHEQRHIGLVL
jgi:hypothetical protein